VPQPLQDRYLIPGSDRLGAHEYSPRLDEVNSPSRRRKGLVPAAPFDDLRRTLSASWVTYRPRSVPDPDGREPQCASDQGGSLAMPEPAPLSNSVTASILNGQPCDLVHELVRGVQGQFPNATPAEVADEVRLRLDRLQRAWQAIRERWSGDDYLIRAQPAPRQAQPRLPKSAAP
jgi:hypothetical protein